MRFYRRIDLDGRDFLAYANCFQVIIRYFLCKVDGLFIEYSRQGIQGFRGL